MKTKTPNIDILELNSAKETAMTYALLTKKIFLENVYKFTFFKKGCHGNGHRSFQD
jgi:hypothetical protein